MKKKILTMALVGAFMFPTVTYAGTLSYSGDIVSFDYAEDLYGTIEYLEDDAAYHYSCKSHSGNYSVSINIISFESYENLHGVGKEEYESFLIKEEDNVALKSTIVEDSDVPEKKTIEKMEGDVTYTKIVAESPNGFIIAVLNEKNENDSTIGNQFRDIYNSIKPNETWLKEGIGEPENPGYSRMIFGTKD